MESPYNLVAGLDIHKKSVVVIVLQSAQPDQDYASGTFGTTQFGLNNWAGIGAFQRWPTPSFTAGLLSRCSAWTDG